MYRRSFLCDEAKIKQHTTLRGGYGEFLIFYDFQPYSTKFARFYWFVITWNLWNIQGILWIISWDIQDIKQKKKHKSKIGSCALDFL